MIANLLKSLFSIFNQKESFLVVEILGKHFNRIALVKADQNKKEFILSKLVNIQGGNERLDGSPASLEFLKKPLKRFGNLDKYKIIISLDSDFSSTIYSSISLVRDNAKDPIDDAELDNLVSQAVWRFFDRHRGKVAQKLKVNDFDIILTDVRVEGIKLDGHRVINPSGFKARSLEINLCQTFTTRSIINELKAILPLHNIQFISEAGAAWSHAIARSSRKPQFLLANIFSDKTLTFLADDNHLIYHDSFNWGEENLNKAVSEEFGVEPVVARDIISLYRNNQTSETFARKLDRILMKELHLLANFLNVSLSQSDIRLVYLHPFFDLPDLAFSAGFRNKFDCSAKIERISHGFISEKYNFNLKFNKKFDYVSKRSFSPFSSWIARSPYGVDPKIAFSIFSAIFEAIFAPHHYLISQMAKKRVRWLSPI